MIIIQVKMTSLNSIIIVLFSLLGIEIKQIRYICALLLLWISVLVQVITYKKKTYEFLQTWLSSREIENGALCGQSRRSLSKLWSQLGSSRNQAQFSPNFLDNILAYAAIYSVVSEMARVCIFMCDKAKVTVYEIFTQGCMNMFQRHCT